MPSNDGIDPKAIRKNLGLTIPEMAKLLRIESKSTIMRWEAGTVPVSGPASIIYDMLDRGDLPERF